MAELYRLALAAEIPEDAWRTRLQWTTVYKGIAGLDDKFVHLSTAEQVVSTAAMHFAGKADVMLLRFSVETMCDEADLEVRWEDSFPHVYGGLIPFACLTAPPILLEIDPDGKHIFPLLGAAAVEAETVAQEQRDVDDAIDRSIEDAIEDDDGYDGGAARGMYG